MGKGQQPSLAQRADESMDEVRETWTVISADGVLETHEVVRFGATLTTAHRLVSETNISQATGLAYLRLGADARRTRDLLRDLDTLDQPAPDAA